jgi:hypothetical protein
VYPLFRAGLILGEEQTGRLMLNDAASKQEFIGALNKIFGTDFVAEDFSPITRGEAIDLVAGILRTTDEGTFEGEDLSNLEYLVSFRTDKRLS